MFSLIYWSTSYFSLFTTQIIDRKRKLLCGCGQAQLDVATQHNVAMQTMKPMLWALTSGRHRIGFILLSKSGLVLQQQRFLNVKSTKIVRRWENNVFVRFAAVGKIALVFMRWILNYLWLPRPSFYKKIAWWGFTRRIGQEIKQIDHAIFDVVWNVIGCTDLLSVRLWII